MKHIKLFENFLNEQEVSKMVAFRVYADWDYEHQMYSHMAQYAVPGDVAKKLIKKYKLDPDDENQLKLKVLGKLSLELRKENYFVDEWGIDELSPATLPSKRPKTFLAPWDQSFSKLTGMPFQSFQIIDVREIDVR
tara:strand:- start:8054 stop:8461 length:408 start_codon:yes stop_codon:yes gene_type:complete